MDMIKIAQRRGVVIEDVIEGEEEKTIKEGEEAD